MTKILILGDIGWELISRTIYHEGGGSITTSAYHTPESVPGLVTKNFKQVEGIVLKDAQERSINRMIEIVDTQKPDLVLFPGDIISDGSCFYTHTYEFIRLLEYLELKEIKSLFIQGNHDYDAVYNNSEYYKLLDAIHSKNLIHTQEISGRTVHINNIVIHGLSFNNTHTRSAMRFSKSNAPNNIDILLTHPDLFVRPALFDFNPKILICGHSDNRMIKIKSTMLLSSGGFHDTVIDYKTNENMTITNRFCKAVVKNNIMEFERDDRSNPDAYPARRTRDMADIIVGKPAEESAEAMRNSADAMRNKPNKFKPNKLSKSTELIKNKLKEMSVPKTCHEEDLKYKCQIEALLNTSKPVSKSMIYKLEKMDIPITWIQTYFGLSNRKKKCKQLSQGHQTILDNENK